ncbi:LPXTG cell wall anchor domain-containing protein, partial [Streptococcus pluranimalium]|uniref:LPXTG cell wall anchor domain-containing protein n=1 Tax=Streptococcus pluranimalium TaxID=82348 RepID=UPI0039FBC889
TPTSYQPVVNYAPVDTLSIKHKAKEVTLPSTGETNSSLLAAYGALGLIAGLGLVARKKRRDDEA